MDNTLQIIQDKISQIQDRLQSLVVIVNSDDSYLPQTEEVDALSQELVDLLYLEAEELARLGRANGTVLSIQEYLDGAGDPEGSL